MNPLSHQVVFMRRRMFPLLVFALLTMSGFLARAAESGGKEWLVYFGTYTGKLSKGIYVSRLNASTGELTAPELVAESRSPSFLALHPGGRYLYSVNEVSQFKGKDSGAVTAYSIDARSGKLTELNQESSVGSGPCHLIVDRAGRNVLVANYGSGSVAVLGIQNNGLLSPSTSFSQHAGSSVNQDRQKEPHAHSVNLDAANRFAVVADLGMDKLMVYKFDPAKGRIVANNPPATSIKPGSGPRHFAFHPNGKFAYVINEMLLTVTALRYDAARGVLEEVQTISTLPPGSSEDTAGFSCAEVQVHPSGKFLFGSNRGHNSIVGYAIDPEKGTLKYIENTPTQGKTPRNFGIEPGGKFLLAANQDSDSVVEFRIDPQSGHLESTGTKIEVGAPVCVKFLAAH